jgi:GNAT superfamily N-acetyltransferase
MGVDAEKATIRVATEADVDLVLQFIRELADYEKLLHEVKATKELLSVSLFGSDPKAKVLILEEGTKPGLYLEDLYVRPAFRGKGYGKELFRKLASLAIEEGCGRVDWRC